MKNKCPICGAPLENGKCSYCGYETIQPTPMGTINNSKDDFCESQNLVKTTSSSTPDNNVITYGISRKRKNVALLLCLFLGGIGAHHFYVGKVGTGLIYLFTLGLFGFGWLIDFILIVIGAFRDEFDLPLKK